MLASEIQCPRKGLMGLGRCVEFQKETAAAGDACTCVVFHAHPDAAELGPIVPVENLCGRVFDKSVERTNRVVTRPKPKGAMAPERELAARRELIADRMRAPKKHNDLTPLKKKEAPMPPSRRPETAEPCEKCGKPSPEGTRRYKGLCEPCRSAAKAEKTPKKEKTKSIDDVAKRHAPPRQKMLPVVAEQEIAQLRAALDEANKKLARIHWLVEGVKDGFAKLEDLAVAARSSG